MFVFLFFFAFFFGDVWSKNCLHSNEIFTTMLSHVASVQTSSCSARATRRLIMCSRKWTVPGILYKAQTILSNDVYPNWGEINDILITLLERIRNRSFGLAERTETSIICSSIPLSSFRGEKVCFHTQICKWRNMWRNAQRELWILWISAGKAEKIY